MSNVEAKFPKDETSPLISFKLWSEITFVNFSERIFISSTVDNLQVLDQLHELGFTAIDTAIADTVMRLNSMEDCKTDVACSGHPGYYHTGYIRFTAIPDSIRKQLDESGIWKHEDEQDEKLGTWRLPTIGDNDTVSWLKAMLFLAEMKGLPKKHCFDEYSLVYSDRDADGRIWVSFEKRPSAE